MYFIACFFCVSERREVIEYDAPPHRRRLWWIPGKRISAFNLHPRSLILGGVAPDRANICRPVTSATPVPRAHTCRSMHRTAEPAPQQQMAWWLWCVCSPPPPTHIYTHTHMFSPPRVECPAGWETVSTSALQPFDDYFTLELECSCSSLRAGGVCECVWMCVNVRECVWICVNVCKQPAIIWL